MNRYFLLVFFLILPVFLSGCETVKYAGIGFKKDLENCKITAGDIGQKVKQTDEWTQKNIW